MYYNVWKKWRVFVRTYYNDKEEEKNTMQSLTKNQVYLKKIFTSTRKDKDQRNAEITAFLSLDNVEATNKRPALRIVFMWKRCCTWEMVPSNRDHHLVFIHGIYYTKK